MISQGYGDVRTLERRVQKMEEWLANPSLMSADADAEYAAVIEIDLAEVNEPIVCCPPTQTMLACCPRWPVPRSMRFSLVPA